MKGDVDYSRAVLIVWDMQYGIAPSAFNYAEVVANARRLIDSAHLAGIPAIYSQSTALPYQFQSESTAYSMRKRGIYPRTPRMVAGTHDWEILKELRPESQDVVVQKHTPDFFVGTPVHFMLQNMQASTIILAGVATEIGIESTARAGAALGFIPVVAEDAVGGRTKEAHEASLLVMRQMFELRKTDEIVADLGKVKAGLS